jgi:hypothetical protein
MRRVLVVVAMLALGAGVAHGQGCTPEVLQQLRQRGASPQVIANVCGSGATGGATLCVTRYGSCPVRGVAVNTPCSCPSQFGTVQGTAR